MTIAVVSWNTSQLLNRCLESMRPDVDAGRAEVWVVDNASSDASPEVAREHASWARLVALKENIGFGAAVNLVARQTQSAWLVSANADIELTPGALERMLAAASEPSTGCVAPRLELPDGSTQHSVHPFPNVGVMVALQLGLHRLHRKLGERLCLPGYWDPGVSRDVPWAIGAFLLLRRAAFDAVGGYDEQQWMYAEDLDLGWRLRDAGWRTRYEPRALIKHASEAATATAFGEERVARWQRATYAVILRRRGPVRMWIVAALNVTGSAARIGLLAIPAIVLRRLRTSIAEHRMWIRVHLQGLRRPSVLLHPAAPACEQPRS